jgi:glycosyltransferase involved in cell wall biosynthesis
MAGYRIAMVAACPFPANYGSPGAIREMAQSLALRGNAVHVVTYPFGEDLPADHLTIWRCGWSRKRSRPIYSGPSLEKIVLDLFLLVRLCQVIRRQSVEVIHATNYEGVLLGFFAKLITRRPLLYNAVNLMSDELHLYKSWCPTFLLRWSARLLDWLVTVWPDGFIANTNELRQEMLARGVSPDLIAVVPTSVDLQMFQRPTNGDLRAKYELGDRPIVMYTGINSPIQRIDYLLRAFAVVHQEIQNALLMVVSPLEHDPDLPQNQSLAAELKVDSSVVWVEGHKLSELPDFLALAAVTVISRPNSPGHPVKLLNYMAAGKPIVCPAGAAKGVRHMHDAFLTRDHDWQHLAEGTITLLRDRVLAESLGSNARSTVTRDFDRDALCVPVEGMYQMLTNYRTRIDSATT